MILPAPATDPMGGNPCRLPSAAAAGWFVYLFADTLSRTPSGESAIGIGFFARSGRDVVGAVGPFWPVCPDQSGGAALPGGGRVGGTVPTCLIIVRGDSD